MRAIARFPVSSILGRFPFVCIYLRQRWAGIEVRCGRKLGSGLKACDNCTGFVATGLLLLITSPGRDLWQTCSESA